MPDLFDASKQEPPTENTEVDVENTWENDEMTEPLPETAESSDNFQTTEPSPIERGESHLSAGRGARLSRRPRSLEEGNSAQFAENPQARRPLHRHVDDYSEVMRKEKSSKNHLASYLPKPQGLSFDTQAATEHIILVLRRHPITQLKWILIAIGLALSPLLFSSIGLIDFLPGNYRFALSMGWYLLVVGFMLESFLHWFFHVYIITDERIIDVDFLSLIYRNISAAKIDNIEDVSAVTGGFTASVFDLGTVFVQTAAEKREFDFEDVPHPSKVTALLNELILEEEREKIEGRVS